ncbi:MAG: ATP-binding cassette domain-containing protein [Verrucomicrobia bacterium]|nr:ATP-binding cassette domain-containing protein [Verrucomicrobiota bacterium]
MSSSEEAWYLHGHDGPLGPFSTESVLNRLKSGEIGRDSHIWREGWAAWQLIADTPEFLESPAQAEIGEEDISAAPEVLQIKDLHVGYGKRLALNGLNLSVRTGEIFGFLGNNGAGKTTTIHSILGLLPATSGSISILGMNPARDQQSILQKTGFCPERDEPYDWIKLRTLFSVGRHAFSRWDSQLCADLTKRFDLDISKAIKELSKGMVAKARLLMALSHRPECLILDEPTSSLDPASRNEFLSIISDVSRSSGVTTIFSSHNLHDITGIATHIGIIDSGRMLFHCSMKSISTRARMLSSPHALQLPAPQPASLIANHTHGDAQTKVLITNLMDPDARIFVESLSPGSYTLYTPSLEEIFLFMTSGVGVSETRT